VALGSERRALARVLVAPRPGPLGPFPALLGQAEGQWVLLVQAGLGATRAREAALLAGRRYGCPAVWSLGLAGGLDPALRPGDLLLPDAVLPLDAAVPAPSGHGLRAALASLAPCGGSLVTATAPVLTVADKRALRAATGAAGVDMEAAGVGEAAARLGVPWLALKIVLDTADRALPPALAACAAADGSLRVSALLAALTRPAGVAAAARLAGESRRALRALARALRAAVGAWGRLDRPTPVQ